MITLIAFLKKVYFCNFIWKNHRLFSVCQWKKIVFSITSLILFISIFININIIGSEVTDSFSFPGGKLQRVDGIWEEIKGNQSRVLNEGGRDKDWVLLLDMNKKLLYNLPSKGGQSYWTTESEKTKWKPWQIVKRDINSKY